MRLSDYEWQLAVGFGFLVVYLALLLWARRAYIARSNQQWTEAQRRAFLAALPALGGETAPARAALERLEMLWRDRPCTGAPRASDHIADWVLLHEAKRLAAWRLLPDAHLRARLERAMGQLDELPAARRAEWARRYQQLGGADGSSAEVRATLVELLSELYNTRDAKYAQLSSLYNKAFWLTASALLPLAVLVILGYGILLVAGAIGGLISRLQRLVYAEGLPTAYGSSWVPLFGAPLLGALAAWGGLHLLTVLRSLGVVDLSALLPESAAGVLLAPTPPVIGLAVLLGLSERVLNQFGKQAEKVLSPDGEPAGHQPAPTAPPAAPPAAAAPGGGEPVTVGAGSTNGSRPEPA